MGRMQETIKQFILQNEMKRSMKKLGRISNACINL